MRGRARWCGSSRTPRSGRAALRRLDGPVAVVAAPRQREIDRAGALGAGLEIREPGGSELAAEDAAVVLAGASRLLQVLVEGALLQAHRDAAVAHEDLELVPVEMGHCLEDARLVGNAPAVEPVHLAPQARRLLELG